MGSHPVGLEAAAESSLPASLSTQTVTVYARHTESCPKNGEPYWKRCHCMKYLYEHSGWALGQSREARRTFLVQTRPWVPVSLFMCCLPVTTHFVVTARSRRPHQRYANY